MTWATIDLSAVPAPLRKPIVADTLSSLFVVLTALVDWASGAELAFSAFYLLPIGYASLFGHRGAGVAAAAGSALAFPVTDILAGREFTSIGVIAWNISIRFATYAVLVALLRNLLRQLEHAEQLSRTDALTGLTRGFHVRELIDAELQRGRRYHRPLSVAYVDVDEFKRVNDTLGHAGGDELLRSIAGAMQRSTRQTDVCARMGGDEFLILMPETDASAAQIVIERLQRELERLDVGNDLQVTMSIGLATFETMPGDADEAIRRVDDLMYSVKKNGKNSYVHQRMIS